MSIGEFFQIKKKNVQDQWRAVRCYYPKSWRFAVSDLVLGLGSLFFNPYRLCRKNGSVYGETPIESLRRIASFCSLSSDDTWLDLGSGRGKGCFWIAHFIGCRTIGVEQSALFVHLANAICRLLKMKKLSFVCSNILDADFSKATCVYIYSTCLDEVFLAALTERMQKLPEEAKVITISAPLPETNAFSCRGSFPISFPWGNTEAYLHIKTKICATASVPASAVE